MDKTKKILIACVGVLIVICAVSLGMLIGSRMNKAESAAAETAATEAVAQEELTAEMTQEYVPETVFTEPVYDAPTEPETYPTAAPTTQAPTTKPATTKAPTTKAPTTKPTTTKAPTTAAPTTKVTTTAAPTTTTTTRSGAYTLVVYGDSGASDVIGTGRYAAGEMVKVSMTPYLGYTFQRWESSDKSVLADSTSQTYMFQMPASSLSLRAVTYTRPIVTLYKGTGISSVSGGRAYAPGEKVTVSAQVADGYEFAGWSSSSGNGTASAGLTGSSPTFTFTMPNQSVTLTANAKAKTYSVRLYAGTGVYSVSGEGKYKPGDTVTVRINMRDGYTLNNDWTSVNASYNGNVATFVMPARDVSLTASGTQNQQHLVTLTMTEGVRDVQGSGKYYPGETVTVRCTIDSGYKFSRWETSNIQYAAGSRSQTYSFRMPDGDVNLTAYAERVEEQKYLVSLELGSGIYNVSGSGMYAPGERVTVDCTVLDGYSFSSWTVHTPTAVEEVTTKRYTFTMPRGEMRLKANAVQADGNAFGF